MHAICSYASVIGMRGLELNAFLAEVEIGPAQCARESGVHISVVMRTMSRETIPDGVNMTRFNTWAYRVAELNGIPPSRRLSWGHLLEAG